MADQMLPNGYRFASGPAYLKLLTARDPKNTNAPGLQGNKNGPPGPEGNQKGPPGKTASSVDLPPPPPPATPTTPSLSTSPFPGSTSSTPSSLVTTSISTSSLDLTSSSAIVTSTSFLTSYTTNRSTVQSLTAADISTSGDGISTATSYLAPVPSSSGLVLFTVSTGKTPLQTTSASADSTSAVTTSQSWMYSSAPNGTGSFKSNLLSPGQKAGISIGTIAGFALFLSLIFLLFKRGNIKLPKTLLGCGRSRWASRNKTVDTQPGSQIEAQVESTSNTNWDYRETFARPTMIQKARRSLHKPLTGLRRINPLGLNPIAPETTGPGTPSRKSFSSFFHRRSVASSHPTASQVSLLLEQSRGAGVPQSPPPLPPLYTAFPPVRPSSMPGRSTGLGQDETSGSLSPLKMRLPAHKLTSHHRISQVTNNSTESKANSIKSVPGWVKFHLPSGLQSGGTMTQESEKPLPSVPPGISPGLWLKTKVLPRFYSASDDVENGYRIGTGNGNKLEDTKQATFERNKSKEVQVGQRMSDPSAGSMMTGKLEV